MNDEVPITHNNKILIVDDVQSNRLLLRKILERSGYEADECCNGIECVEYCSETLPKMILLDIMMPEMDGIEACKLLRSMYSQEDLPIVIVSTKSEGEDVKIGLMVGASDYVTKPVDRHILLARIQSQIVVSASQRELKQQQIRLERALRMQNALGDVLPDAIAVHDASGLLLYSNESLMNVCGGGVPGSIEETIKCIYDGRLAEYWKQEFEDIVSSNDRESYNEIVVPGKPQQTYEIISTPFSVEDGAGLRVWLWRDLTPMRGLERKLQQQVKIDTVSTFTAGISHNFNNIVGTVLGAADLLDRVVQDSERGKRCVNIIRKAVTSGKILTDRMTGMTRRVLENQQAAQGELSYALNSIFEIQQEVSGKELEFSFEGEHDALPEMSRRNLLVIITNLVSNAVDSIDTKGSVSLDLRSTEDGKIRMSVADTGCGMSSNQVDRVCEPFYSTKNMDEKNQVSYEGNGLGMWNVLNIVRLYGGSLDIQSAPGKGTTVTVLFPVAVDTGKKVYNQ